MFQIDPYKLNKHRPLWTFWPLAILLFFSFGFLSFWLIQPDPFYPFLESEQAILNRSDERIDYKGMGQSLFGLIPLVVSVVFLSLTVILTVQFKWQPISLSEFVGKSTIPLLENETLIVSWANTLGPSHRWKLCLKIVTNSSDNKAQMKDLAMKLLMKSVVLSKVDENQPQMYEKLIFARDWPRQELLIRYWLSTM